MKSQRKATPRLPKLPFFGRRSDTERALAAAEAPPYGLVAEFDNPEALLEAAKRARAEGYRKMDAYSPIPVEELAETIGFRTRLPLVVLFGGLTGAALGFLLQTWASVWDYPLNVGGRPLFSWPSFIPAIFELTVLFSAFAAVLGLILFSGLPQPYHPIFNTPNFDQASRDKFFFCIEASDPKFDARATRQFLEGLGPQTISEVPQ
jgi:hypothetical protein